MILRIRTEEIFCSTLDKEDFYMKPVKKILALILAGVMALAMLTGCGKQRLRIVQSPKVWSIG